MKQLLFTLMLLVSVASFAHEGHQAFYRLYVENGTLTLTAKVEIPDLKTAVEKQEFCSKDQDFNFCAGLWLIDNVSVIIDEKTHSLTLESTTTEEGHLILEFSLGPAPDGFQKIDFKNTAFTKAFDHYENILEIEIDNHNQGYKLTETRTSISHRSTNTK